jgi:hypothetical protein
MKRNPFLRKPLEFDTKRVPMNFSFTPRLTHVISFDYPTQDKKVYNNKQRPYYEKKNINPIIIVGGFENNKIIHGTNLRYFQFYPNLIAALHQLISDKITVNSYNRATGELLDYREVDISNAFSYSNIDNYVIPFKPRNQPNATFNIMEYYWRSYNMELMKNVNLININNVVSMLNSGGLFK